MTKAPIQVCIIFGIIYNSFLLLAATRIEKRLFHQSASIPPSKFHSPSPPFSLLKMEVLRSKMIFYLLL